MHRNEHHGHAAPIAESAPRSLETDRVCGMKVDARRAKYRLEHDGKTWFFCNPRCLEKFRSTPTTYLAPKVEASKVGAAMPAEGAPVAVYTCPMHPEVEQIG